MSGAEEGAWAALDTELAAWRAAGRIATLWWRDDDAGDAVPAAMRLIALSEQFRVPLALAAVPAWTTNNLALRVAASPLVTVMQHGYAHINHAPAGEKKAELGPERPAAQVVAELAQGRHELERRFGNRFVPIMVPPWNRMAPYLTPFLAELRFAGLSQFGPRGRAEPVRGLVQGNGHVDIVHWKSAPPRFAGTAKLVGEYVRHLAARRLGSVDAAEPTGLLTHHLAQDDACWAFLDALFVRLARHGAVRWLTAAETFAPAVRR